jgi:hypothetical protein
MFAHGWFLRLENCSILTPEALDADPSDKWYVMTIGGSPVGYVHETVTRAAAAGTPVIRTASETKMVLNRLGTKVELGLLSSTEETAGGVLRRLVSELKASVLSTKTEAVFRGGKIEVRTESGGKTYSRTLDAPGDLLGPEGIRRLTLAGLKTAGDSIEYRTFESELAAVTKGTRRVLSRESLTVGGRTIETLKVEETIEAGGMIGTVWLDPAGEAVRQVMPTPFGEGVVVLADRASALAAASGGELPPEMFERSIIRANVRMPRAREISRLAVRLVGRNPGMAWPEIKLPSQTARVLPDGSLEIVIERGPAPSSQPPFPVRVMDANREFLEANAYIQSDDAGLKALAAGILGGEKRVFLAAEKLRRWVADNMTFDLGIAMAPSSEIFRDRRGTCVGYATLLAALARAAGIPSRVVIGYVYALGMFGGHAWTEILAGETWIPIDAALPSGGIADAARIGLLATSFRDGTGSLGSGAAYKIFGQVGMRILEFTVGAKPSVRVPDGAAPYRVDGDTYENPWLGIAFRKPEGFTFSKLDAVWPDPTVAAADGPNGKKLVLREAYLKPWLTAAETAAQILAEFKGAPRQADWRGRTAFRAEAAAQAAIFIIDGLEAWVLTVEGAGAPAVLDKLLEGFSIRNPD